MNKLLLSLILCMFLFANVSAIELNPFADSKVYEPIIKEDMSSFIKQDFNPDYGVIRLSNTFLWIETSKIAEYSLTSISESIIDINMNGKATLYKEGTLFDDTSFNGSAQGNYYILKPKDNYVDVPVFKEVCNEVLIDNNTLELKEICKNIIESYTQENQPIEVWELYNQETLNSGDYYWKWEGKRNINSLVDVIPIKSGKDFIEWVWFNTSWDKCRNINISSAVDFGSRTDVAIFSLTGSGWNSDGSDIRILNDSCKNGGTEVPYNVINASAGNINVSFQATNLTTNNTLTYSIYYGNAGATTTENTNIPIYYLNDSNIDTQLINRSWSFYPIVALGITIDSGAIRSCGGNWNATTYCASSQSSDAATGIAISGSFYLGTNLSYQCRFVDATQKGGIDLDNNGNIDIAFTNCPTGADNPPQWDSLDTTNYKGQLARIILNDTSAAWLTWTLGKNQNASTSLEAYPIIVNSIGDEQTNELRTLTIQQSYPSNNTNLSTLTPTLACNFTSNVYNNISSVKVNVYNSSNYLSYTNTETASLGVSYNKTWTTSTLIDDVYNWSCYGYGNGGINASTGNWTLRLDTTAPTITITNPVGDVYFANQSLNFSISDASTISSCWYSFNGAANITTTNCGNSSVILNLGFNTIQGYANDSLGNLGYTNVSAYLYPTLALCNSTINKGYLNITFRDEISTTAINGTLSPLTIIYYINDGLLKTRTYTLTNTSLNNPVYQLCAYTNSTEIHTNITGSSLMTGYPTRNWNLNAVLTNVTTVKVVDLLATADGVYQAIVVTGSSGGTLTGALVTASTSLLGVVNYGTSDSNGALSLWLDPNKAHTLLTTLTGYPSDSRVINPSPSTTVYITLGGTTSYDTSLTYSYSEGIQYSFKPTNKTLYNNTAYDFQFILSSSIWTVSQYGFNLYNSSGSIIGAANDTTNGGTVSVNYNVVNNSKMTMLAFYVVNGTIKYLSQEWAVINTDDTSYSILFLRNRIITYIDSGFFGLKKGTGLNLFCFIIIFIIIGSMSWKYSINEPIIISAATTFLVWFFEYGLGFIDVGFPPMTAWAGIITLGLLIKEGLKVV